MNTFQRQVKEFMELFGQSVQDYPRLIDKNTAELRVKLIDEELNELVQAVEDDDLVEVADALGDILYVVYGAALSYGIDMEPIFNEIHRSNISKLWREEELVAAKDKGYLISPTPYAGLYVVKNADGKVMKSPSYSPANLQRLIKA